MLVGEYFDVIIFVELGFSVVLLCML